MTAPPANKPANPPGAPLRTTGFGDSPALSARLLDLIRSGAKTATCGALRDYLAEGEAIPQQGERLLALDWDGQPALIYQLTEVQVVPFNQVSDDFARAEGEGSPADWRAAHEAFFSRNGGFAPDMPVVCERFSLVRDLAPGADPARHLSGADPARHQPGAGQMPEAGRTPEAGTGPTAGEAAR